MAKNTDLTKLDWYQAAKKVIQDSDDAFRVVVGSGSEFEIALDSAEDSVATKAQSDSEEASLTNSSPTGQLLIVDSDGFSKASIYVKNSTAIVGPQAITLEVSPSASGSFWVATSTTLTPGTVDQEAKISSLADINAKRVRLTTAVQLTSGTAQVILLLKA